MRSYLHGNLCFHFVAEVFNICFQVYGGCIYFQTLMSVKKNCIIVIHLLRSVLTHKVASNVRIDTWSFPRPPAQWAFNLTKTLRHVLVSSE
jgi:hypothetical protein